MKKIVLILLFLPLLSPLACSRTCGKKILNTDDFTYTVIRFDKSYTWIFKNAEPSDLTVEEIKETERLLLTCIEEYNREPYPLKAHPEYKLDKNKFIIDLTQYKKQFIPVLNRKGEKEVWVNCFCEDNFNDWKQQIVKVQDGGKCFFNVKINLMTKECYGLRVNGEA